MAVRISQSELYIMNVLWDKSPLAASDVFKALDNEKDWSSRTVKTLLSRLVEKGALSTEADGRRYLYAPLIQKETYATQAARSLTDRLFGGRAAPLVAHLAESEGLTDSDIEELEALLAKLKK
ncbi:putative transcriptional regulator [Litorimonas taeanensis]|uniref:Putative transcriptional regulator n=1 Tax=Litorimonas taeanensis TaxID=568099 RepID=A0A420WMR5_9PROT|nr:BlaI/MecI/CopY family transcriptional regulator [Litorimonas taeanensis]RKQ72212.1 putative transcriptional regulator [Litorimonas taeanensis]